MEPSAGQNKQSKLSFVLVYFFSTNVTHQATSAWAWFIIDQNCYWPEPDSVARALYKIVDRPRNKSKADYDCSYHRMTIGARLDFQLKGQRTANGHFRSSPSPSFAESSFEV